VDTRILSPIIVLLVGLLAGCAASGPKRPEWTKAGATTMDLNQDRYDCEQRHRYPTPGSILGPSRLDEGMFRSCMQARGWAHEDD
jgi:hypothetical protein